MRYPRKCASNLLLLVSVLVCSSLWALPCAASELKRETIAAFDQYVKATERRMSSEVRPGGAFLYPDRLPPENKDEIYKQIRGGAVIVSRLETSIENSRIQVPKGIIHHWVGIAFIPRTNLTAVLHVAKDYEHRTEVYQPDVIASKLLWHEGTDYKVFLRIFQKQFTTVVFNTEYTVHWGEVDPKNVYSISYSTKIAEVKDASNPNGPELPVGNDHGYLWRLYTYWRFAEKDGGVYVQCETISLTRDIPFGLGWLIRPLVTSIPRQSLDRVLAKTRAAVVREPGTTSTLVFGCLRRVQTVHYRECGGLRELAGL